MFQCKFRCRTVALLCFICSFHSNAQDFVRFSSAGEIIEVPEDMVKANPILMSTTLFSDGHDEDEASVSPFPSFLDLRIFKYVLKLGSDIQREIDLDMHSISLDDIYLILIMSDVLHQYELASKLVDSFLFRYAIKNRDFHALSENVKDVVIRNVKPEKFIVLMSLNQALDAKQEQSTYCLALNRHFAENAENKANAKEKYLSFFFSPFLKSLEMGDGKKAFKKLLETPGIEEWLHLELIKLLKKPQTMDYAFRLLIRFKPNHEQVILRLGELLGHENKLIRQAAVKILERSTINSEKKHSAIAALEGDPCINVRIAVKSVLGVPLHKLKRELVRTLSSDQKDERDAAYTEFKRFKSMDNESHLDLVGALSDPYARDYAYKILQQYDVKHPGVFYALLDKLEDTNSKTRSYAASILGIILTQDFIFQVDPSIIAVFLNLAESKDRFVRAVVVNYLLVLDPDSEVTKHALLKLLDDTNFSVVHVAAKALMQQKPVESQLALIRFLALASTSEKAFKELDKHALNTYEVQHALVRNLKHIIAMNFAKELLRTSELLPQIIEMLNAKRSNPALRKAIDEIFVESIP